MPRRRTLLVSSFAVLLGLLGWRATRPVPVHLAVRVTEPPTVLLLPGYGLGVATWDSLTPRLTASGYRVVAVAPRWHEGSSVTSTGYSFDTLAADFVRVLDSLGVAQAHVVGHSSGGDLATALAVRYPDRVASVALLDAAYDRAVQPRLGTPSPPPAYLARYWQLIHRAPEWSRLPAVPVLAVYAPPTDSSLTPRWRPWYAHSRPLFARTLPAAHIAVVDGAGHYVHQTRPDTVVALLTAFWRGVP